MSRAAQAVSAYPAGASTGARPALWKQTLGPRLFAVVLTALWAVLAFLALHAGWAYYLTPLAERPYSDLHEVFAPSGTIGLRFGVLGAAMMGGGVLLYGVRKRVAVLQRAGPLTYWLQFHIFLCTLGPFLVLLHTSFKFGGIVSIAFWSMTTVVISGFFGRYVFVRIPKTINGRFRSLESIREQKAMLVQAIARDADLPVPVVERLTGLATFGTPRGFLHALVLAVRLDLSKRRQTRRIHKVLNGKPIPKKVRDWAITLLHEQLELEQQIVLLRPFQRMFRWWHLLHLPLAIVMLVIVAAHIAVATMFGYGWPF